MPTRIVNASFDVYGMIGDPVSQTQTPELFNTYCRDNKYSAVMVPLRLSGKSDLENLLDMMKNSQALSGLVSTIPFKADLYNICDQYGPATSILRKVNTVKISPSGDIIGEMFDGIGFIQALKAKAFSFSGANCLIIGCGAAGQAICAELHQHDIASCTIIDPDMSALDRFRTIMPQNSDIYHLDTVTPNDVSKFDLIINASPLGMTWSDPLPCNLETLKSGCYVGDCVTNFNMTKFLKTAKAKEAMLVTGADMAKGQLKSILNFFDIIE